MKGIGVKVVDGNNLSDTKMDNGSDKTFLSTNFLITSPYGSVHDPDSFEGLAKASLESFMFGSKLYPSSKELFIALESCGAQFVVDADDEWSSLYINVPKENFVKAKEILFDIFENPKFEESDLNKVLETIKMNIDQLHSDDATYASMRLKELILGKKSPYGSKESVQNITLEHVANFVEKLKNNYFTLKVDSAEVYQLSENVNLTHLTTAGSYKKREESTLSVLEREIGQKVLMYGLNTDGINGYPYPVRVVANSILSAGMIGLVPEKIREENSAAYYAYASMDMGINSGMFYMCAGVSEDNLTKALQLMVNIYSDVSNGEYEDRRLNNAKQFIKGNLNRIYDEPSRLSDFFASWVCRGQNIPTYEELMIGIDSVNKDDVTALFSSIIKSNKPVVVINGQISKEIENNCKSIIENV